MDPRRSNDKRVPLKNVGAFSGFVYALFLAATAMVAGGMGHGNLFPMFMAAAPLTAIVAIAARVWEGVGFVTVFAPFVVWTGIGHLVGRRQTAGAAGLLLVHYVTTAAMWWGWFGPKWAEAAYRSKGSAVPFLLVYGFGHAVLLTCLLSGRVAPGGDPDKPVGARH